MVIRGDEKMDDRIAAVEKMQEYIEKNLDKEISLSQLSSESMFSPWHSYRLFKLYIGITPSEYIRKLRLSQSAMRLKKENCKIIDAAYQCGFSSVDGYQRAFLKEFGCNPKEYAKAAIPLPLFIAYKIKFKEFRKDNIDMENLQSVFIQVIKKEARKVIIKRGISAQDYFPYCEEVGCDIWGILLSMDSMCGEPVCLWLPDSLREKNTSVYVQGIEAPLDYNGKIPEGFDIISLPQAEYLMFQGEPFKEEDYCQAIAALQHAMNSYDPSVIGYEWDNSQPRIQLEPRGERGYIEMRAITHKLK